MQPLQSHPWSHYILPIRGGYVVGMQRRTWYAGLVTVSFPKVAPPGAADDLALVDAMTLDGRPESNGPRFGEPQRPRSLAAMSHQPPPDPTQRRDAAVE